MPGAWPYRGLIGAALVGLLALPASAVAQDLWVKDFEAGVSGTSVTYRAEVCNSGAAVAGGFDLELYHYRSREPDCTTLESQSYRFARGLSPGACVTHTFQQQGATKGGHTAWARIDADCEVAETDEGNNNRSDIYTVGNSHPDYYVARFSATASGATVAFIATVCNGGGSSSNAVDLEIFHHRLLAPGCGAASSQTHRIRGGLAAGTCLTRGFTLTGASSGSYTAWARVDADCEVAESNELNNNRAWIYPVQAAKPDLYLSSLSASVSGTTVTYSAEVCNGGAAVGSAFDLELYHHRDAAPGCSSPASQQLRFGSGLGAGVCATRSFTRSAAPTGSQVAWARVDADCKISESDEANNHRAAIYQVGQPPPELRVALAPVQVSGSSAMFQATVCNHGGSTTSAFNLELYDKLKPTPGCNTPYSRHHRLASGLAAGACVTRGFVRGSLKAGMYTVWARADANCEVLESEEGNNNASRTYAVGKPDLVTAGLSVAETGGDAVTYDARVCNAGAGTGAPLALGLYYKSVLAPGCSSTPSQTTTLAGGLGSGDCARRTFLHRGATFGSFKGWARADAACAVAEARENNNNATLTYVVGPTRPNLYLSNFVISVDDSTVAYEIDICNSGVAFVAPLELELYHHRDTAPSCSAVQSQAFPLSGQSRQGCYRHTFVRYGAPAGVYTAWVRADADCQVAEGDETDNTLSRTYVVGPAKRAELYVSKLDAVVAGRQVTLTVTVCNAGASSGAFDLGLFYQRPAEPRCGKTPDQVLRLASGLASGQCETRTSRHTAAAAGVHTAWALADSGCKIGETHEADNLVSRAYTVAAAGPDLRVSKLDVSVNGPRLTLEVTACNRGLAPSGAFQVGLFSRRAAAPGCADAADGKASFGALAAAACETRRLTLAAPPAGTYRAWALADAACAVAEADERNNTLSQGYGVALLPPDAGVTADAELLSDALSPDRGGPVADAERNEEDAGATVDGGAAEVDGQIKPLKRGTPAGDGGGGGEGCACRLTGQPRLDFSAGLFTVGLALLASGRRRRRASRREGTGE